MPSSKAFSDWAEWFYDPIIVTAVLDRLPHHSVVIRIKGNSCPLGPIKFCLFHAPSSDRFQMYV
ncbi:MAG: ATP-binding protein [Deltaproteobacteria bacterium]|nr:ATP-binding protein [Deltaproteobacteria bacterium]